MNNEFVELGTYCQNRYKDSLDGKNSKYQKTLFVAIDEDNNIFTSTTPHILRKAARCILIHERLSIAVTNWYRWYNVEFINEKGEVLDNRLDEEFELCVMACGGFANQRMELVADKKVYFSCKAPWENCIKKVWDLYRRLKEVTTKSERVLISSLFSKDDKILELEKTIEDFSFKTKLLEEERNTYKGLLDEMTELVNN